MSDNMMDTEPGGENTQYESIQTDTNPHSKQGGQFGDPSTEAPITAEAGSAQTDPDQAADRGARTAENMKYGQSISEDGMSGQTSTNSGIANAGGGYGGTQKAEGNADAGNASGQRQAAGYGGKDMDRGVGG